MAPSTPSSPCQGVTKKGNPCLNRSNNPIPLCRHHEKDAPQTPCPGDPTSGRSPLVRRRISIGSMNAGFERLNIGGGNLAETTRDEEMLIIPSIERDEPQIIVTPSKERPSQVPRSCGDARTRFDNEAGDQFIHRRAKSCEAEIPDTTATPNQIEDATQTYLGRPLSPTPKLSHGEKLTQRSFDKLVPPGLPLIRSGKLVEKLYKYYLDGQKTPDKPGQIYVLRIPPRDQSEDSGVSSSCDPETKTVIVKIGSSSNVFQRVAEHERKCKYGELPILGCFPYLHSKETIDVSKKMHISYPKRVEELIKEQLIEEQVPTRCICGVLHKEYFRINEHRLDELYECVEWWVRWSEQTYGLPSR